MSIIDGCLSRLTHLHTIAVKIHDEKEAPRLAALATLKMDKAFLIRI